MESQLLLGDDGLVDIVGHDRFEIEMKGRLAGRWRQIAKMRVPRGLDMDGMLTAVGRARSAEDVRRAPGYRRHRTPLFLAPPALAVSRNVRPRRYGE